MRVSCEEALRDWEGRGKGGLRAVDSPVSSDGELDYYSKRCWGEPRISGEFAL